MYTCESRAKFSRQCLYKSLLNYDIRYSSQNIAVDPVPCGASLLIFQPKPYPWHWIAWRSFLFRIFFDGYNGILIRWPHVVAMGNALVFPLITSTVMLRSWSGSLLSDKAGSTALPVQKYNNCCLWRGVIFCTMDQNHRLNLSSISVEQPLLLLNVMTERRRLMSTSVVPPDSNNWKSSGVKDDKSSDGMTSCSPFLIDCSSLSTQPIITLVAYNLTYL